MRFVVGSDDEGEALDAAVDELRRARARGRAARARPVARRRRPGRPRGRSRRGRPGRPLLLDGHGHRDGREQGARRARGARLGSVDRRGRPALERRERARDEPEADDAGDGARDRRRVARRSRRRTRTSARTSRSWRGRDRRDRLGDDLRARDRVRDARTRGRDLPGGAIGEPRRARRGAHAACRAPAADRHVASRRSDAEDLLRGPEVSPGRGRTRDVRGRRRRDPDGDVVAKCRRGGSATARMAVLSGAAAGNRPGAADTRVVHQAYPRHLRPRARPRLLAGDVPRPCLARVRRSEGGDRGEPAADRSTSSTATTRAASGRSRASACSRTRAASTWPRPRATGTSTATTRASPPRP